MDVVTLNSAKNYTDAVVGGEIPTGQYADISKMFYPNNQYGGIVSSNFNTIAVSGFYTGYGTATGVPDADYSWFVYHHNSNVGTASAYQKAVAYYSTSVIAYERVKISDTWSAWVLVGSGSGGSYDLDNEKLSTVLFGATAETTIADDDTMPMTDTSATNSTKKITWANIKSVLKTYFDTLYMKIISGSIVADATTLSITLTPNVNYKTATLTICTSLTILLGAGSWFDEYLLYFTTGAVAPTITLPVGINWVGGTPTFSTNKTYIISIQNGIGVVANV